MKLRTINYAFAFFITFLLAISISQVRYFLQEYGISYEVTTVIGTEISTRTASIYENFIVIGFLFALLITFMLNIASSYPLKTGEKT